MPTSYANHTATLHTLSAHHAATLPRTPTLLAALTRDC